MRHARESRRAGCIVHATRTSKLNASKRHYFTDTQTLHWDHSCTPRPCSHTVVGAGRSCEGAAGALAPWLSRVVPYALSIPRASAMPAGPRPARLVRAILRVILSLLLEVQCIHARRHAHRLALRAPLGASGRFALVRYASVQGKLPHLKGGGSASVGFGRLRRGAPCPCWSSRGPWWRPRAARGRSSCRPGRWWTCTAPTRRAHPPPPPRPPSRRSTSWPP